MSVKKYFIAIVVPAPLQQLLDDIKQDLLVRYGLKGALRSPAHITLHRPFEWKEEKENSLIDKLKQFEFDKGFDLALNNFAFFEPRVIYADVLRNETLFDLQRQLKFFAARELKLLNEVADERGFHPHVTVAFRDLKKPLFYELQPEFAKKELHGGFKYEGFSLLKLERKWEELVFFPR